MPKRQRPYLKPAEQKGPIALADPLLESETGSPDDAKVSDDAASTRWRGIYVLVPVIIALISSINSLWNYFASEDLEQVLGNPFIKKLENLSAAFTTNVWSFSAADLVFTADPYFRPIFSSLFSINYALFGNIPFGWHVVNVLMHAVVTLLVFVVVREITERNWVAALTAALFAVQPVHAESVAWVSGVIDPLMTLWLLSSFFFYLRFRKRGRWYLLGFSLIFFFLSLLSKETAIAFPVVVAFCELFYFNAELPMRRKLARTAKVLGLFAVPAAIFVLMRYNALGILLYGGQPRYPLVPSLLTIPLATVKYLGLTLLPWGHSYQHYTELIETPGAMFFAPLALLVAVSVGLALIKSKEVTLAAVWFITLLAPALVGLRTFEPAYMVQERSLYAPSIGVCLAIALGIEWLATRSLFGSRGRVVAVASAILLLLVWGAVFVRQNRVWDDTVTVHKNSVALAPRSPIARALLSRAYYEAGRPREAEAEARTALDLDSRCATAYSSLSYYARMSGKLDKACEYLENGVSTVPENIMTRPELATMYLNLGLLYGQRKMFEVGEQNLLRSIEISPRNVAWYYAGQFYTEQGRFEEARVMYEQALAKIPPWFAPIHMRLGLTYEALGDLSRAETEFEQYLELAPVDAPDRENVRKHITTLKGGVAPSK